jgi:hypothetical protein
VENGTTFIESPVESQAQTYMGARSKRINIESAKLFVFNLENGDMVKLYPPYVN